MEGVSSASGKVVTFSVNVSHHGKVFRTETVWRSRDGMGLGLMSWDVLLGEDFKQSHVRLNPKQSHCCAFVVLAQDSNRGSLSAVRLESPERSLNTL